MIAKMETFPNFWGENETCLKPPPRDDINIKIFSGAIWIRVISFFEDLLHITMLLGVWTPNLLDTGSEGNY